MSRYTFFYTLVVKLILGPITAIRYNVKGEKIKMPKGPNLIISNHATNIDYMIIGHKLSCHQAHYVMAENAARNPVIRNLLVFMDDPIIHVKGSNALATIREMHKRFKKGRNVMLFPEGNTSFCGVTKTQDDSVGKLAKLSNANLVLTRIEGGYLSRPRWGTARRKGRINVVGKVIMAEEVKRMSVEELTETINQHIYADDYEEQLSERIEYKSAKKAHGLERAMYLCPECKTVGGMTSSNSHLLCSCGYKAGYDNFGYLTDNNGKSYTLKDAILEQRDWLKGRNGLLFMDEADIFDITSIRNIKTLGKYKIKTYDDHFECERMSDGKRFTYDMNSVDNVAIFKANTLTVFIKTADGIRAYEVKGEYSFNALKYRDLFEIEQ